MMRLGRYELLEELGRGAFGVVYLARDTVLGVERAVKVLHPVLMTDPELVERFRREAKVAARLEHPHIVTVHDFGEAKGRFYIAMRYMAGGALHARLKREGRLEWTEVVRIVKEVAEGLRYAHRKGVVHRDLKPGNLLFDEEGRVGVGDFGLAKAVGETGGSYGLTRTGSLVGTPAYMAPEVWKGEEVGPAVDQYALACLVYEMVTGEALFTGRTPVEVMKKHLLDGPQLPERWPEGVPEGLGEVLRKALAPEPEARYPDVQAFARALARLGEERMQESMPGFVWAMERVPSRSAMEWPTSPQHEIRSGRVSGGTARRVVRIQKMRGHRYLVLSLSFSPDGTVLASGGADGVVCLWRMMDGTLMRILKESDWIMSIAFSPDGTFLATGLWNKKVHLWHIEKGVIARTFQGHTAMVRSVTFSPKGDVLATGSNDGTVRLWRIGDGRLVRLLQKHDGGVADAVFSPDGTLLAVGTWGGAVYLWQVADGVLLRKMGGHRGGVTSVAFSPDGEWVASGSGDSTVRLWRVNDGYLMRILKGHAGSTVMSVAFSPNGSLLATLTLDGTVRLWRVMDGHLEHTLESYRARRVLFSPDGTLLAVGAGDGTVELWKID